MSDDKPAIVLVHGAWHVPGHFSSFIRLLEQAGFDVACPLLPSCDESKRQNASMYADAETVRKEVTTFLDKSRRVIMLLHSYGGVAGTQAVQGLSEKARKAQGLQGGVVHIVYMAAFMLRAGQSVGSASMPRPETEPVEMDEATGTTFLCEPPIKLLYGDIEPEVARKMEMLLVRQTARALGDPLEYEAWRDIPATYLRTKKDEIVFLEWQDRMIKNVRDAGVALEVEEYDSSHSPFLSMPEKTIIMVQRVAGR